MILESLYAHFMRKRRSTNLAKRHEFTPSCPIISVGNITTGGTGKTPAVQWLTRVLQQEGYKVGIAGRGYKGSLSKVGALVSDGQKTFLTATEAGDEAFLHARNLTGAIVAIGANRQQAVELCTQNNADVVILDDGFQFWSLPRNFDLVLLDAQKPLGPNGKLLPVGRLREEPEVLSRADAILFTRSQGSNKAELEALVRKYSIAPIFYSIHAPLDLKNELTGETLPLEWLSSQKIEALAGLANNQQFFSSLRNLQADIQNEINGHDHQTWSGEERKNQKYPLIVTEKDAVKMNFENHSTLPVLSLRIGLDIENENELRTLILGKLSPSS
jgi:tetraacyldisaccharide 4'-kinase